MYICGIYSVSDFEYKVSKNRLQHCEKHFKEEVNKPNQKKKY